MTNTPSKRAGEPSLELMQYVLEYLYEKAFWIEADENQQIVLKYLLDNIKEDNYGFYF